MIILFFSVVFIVVLLFGRFGFAFLATWKGVGWNKGGFTAYCAGCGLRLGHQGRIALPVEIPPERAVPEVVGTSAFSAASGALGGAVCQNAWSVSRKYKMMIGQGMVSIRKIRSLTFLI